MNRKKQVFPLIPVAVGAAAVILFIAILGVLQRGPKSDDMTQAGIAYLESLERKDPDAVDQILRDRYQAQLNSQREELLAQVRSGELDPFTLFGDSVIMGDSRAEGFWYFGFVDEAQTLTRAGDTIMAIHNRLDTLEEMNPQYVYLCYGLNDLKIGYWGSVETFVEKYMEYIAEIRQRLPDTVVVVSSILPARAEVYENAAKRLEEPEPGKEPDMDEIIELRGFQRLERIPAWNEALKAACEENDVIFVDNSQISREYAALWEEDGIHVKMRFYPHWARNLILGMLGEGGTQVEENDP